MNLNLQIHLISSILQQPATSNRKYSIEKKINLMEKVNQKLFVLYMRTANNLKQCSFVS